MKPFPVSSDELVEDLLMEVDALSDTVRQRFATLDRERMAWQPNEDSWGVGQCLVHIARTNQLYLDRVEPALAKARDRGWESEGPLKGGWFGRWFTAQVGPRNPRRVKTPSAFRPRRSSVEEGALEAFLEEQARLRSAVEASRGLDIDRASVPSPVTRLIRFRVSDALRIMVEHTKRHVGQAERVVASEGFPVP